MKKIILFLIIALNIFASNEDEKTMNITAKVIEPLNVVHNGDIEFGNVIQGSSHSSSRHGFTAFGEPGQNIKVSLGGGNLNSFSKSVTLNHESSTDKLTVNLVNVSDYGKNTKLDEKGEFKYDFDAELNVPQNAALGRYAGTLTMAVIFQ
ncbi:MAG: DUF4402 domain-containing protein [Cetobacterium sp.]